MDKLDERFKAFRESLIADVCDRITDAGGELGFCDKDIELIFQSKRDDFTILGYVRGISLSLTDSGSILFCYQYPEWDESHIGYMDVEDSEVMEIMELEEMSTDELYSMLKAVKFK